MRQHFSTSWVGSKQPRKQRKYVHNAPLHVRREFLGATLAKDLRKKHGKRSITVHKGDEVIIMRGTFKKKKGKIMAVDIKRTRVSIEGITRAKRDGTKVAVYFHPSKLKIVSLNLEDKERLKTQNSAEGGQKHASNESRNK